MLQAALSSYRHWAVDMSLTEDCRAYFNEEFAKGLTEIDMRSSPGNCSLSAYGTTNGQILGWDGEKFDEGRVELLKQTVWYRFVQLLNGETSCDTINVFVKPEPHSEQKAKENRWRLISAVSLVDTMIDRILFGWLGRVSLETVGLTPCLVGWTPLYGGWKELARLYQGNSVLCLDKSAWDWTVPGWLVLLWLRFILEITAGASDWWKSLICFRFRMLFKEAVFRFSDGTIVFQCGLGIMKSGCFLTLILNSLGQSFVHYLANIRLGRAPKVGQPRSVGDDTVQKEPEDVESYVKEIQKMGFVVKGVDPQDWVEFCGFGMTIETCVPLYWKKHLFKLQFASDLGGVLRAYQVIYANVEHALAFFQKIAIKVSAHDYLPAMEAKRILNSTA
nr:putative RNA-dependent RNA polymerase [Tartas insect-associated virus]